MKPIRGERQHSIAHDPWENNEHSLGHTEIDHVLSDQGSIESSKTDRQIASGCGCLKPAAGFCAVCSATACEAYFGFCDGCRMPLCPRHSVFKKSPRGQGVTRFCKACAESDGRTKRVKGLIRVALSPFVRFEDHKP